MDKYIFTMVLEITYGIGHFTMNHPRVLKLGLAGSSRGAERYNALTPRSGRPTRACSTTRHSLAESRDTVRPSLRRPGGIAAEREATLSGEELRTIARVCRRVPEHPAETFHEAVQCVTSSISSLRWIRRKLHLFGPHRTRFSIRTTCGQPAGRITPERARELLSLLSSRQTR